MKSLAVAVMVTVAAVLTAFAAGGRSAGATTPGWCKSTSGSGYAAPVTSRVTRNGTPRFTGFGLVAHDHLVTGKNGHVRFCLRAKSTVCDTYKYSDVHIQPPSVPPGSLLVQFDDGDSTCLTAASSPTTKEYGAGTALLTTSDPLWSMHTNGKGATTGIWLGFIRVSGESGEELAVIIGPGQQVTVPKGGDPQAVVPFAATKDESRGDAYLKQFVNPPNLSPPPAGDSPALNRIQQRGFMVVGIDKQSYGRDSQAFGFLKLYFTDLAERWKLGAPQFQFGTTQSAPAALAAGQFDVFAGAPPPSPSVPFFTTPKGVAWQFAVAPDDTTFAAAMTAYLGASLYTGLYGQEYRSAFSAEPNYGDLASLLFPG